MIVPTFKDRGTRDTFERTGYMVFPGLVKNRVPELCSAFREMLDALTPSDRYFHYPMTGTNCISNLALRKRIVDEVSRIITPELGSIIDDYRVIGAGFRVKQVGTDSLLPLHQDPTQVDEDRYWLMNIIVPIVDTSRENGALQVIPGSHRIMPRLRSLDLEDRAETLNLHEVMEPLIETVPMRTGDAIFYFQSLLHGSGPNMTREARPVVLGTLMAREAPVTVYFRKQEQPHIFERYEVPDDYFNQMEDFDRDHKLRPKVGRRVDDVEDTYNLSRDEIITAFRALAQPAKGRIKSE